jgi:hypothetical protein
MNRQELSAIVLELLEKETGESYPGVTEATTLREGLNLDVLTEKLAAKAAKKAA